MYYTAINYVSHFGNKIRKKKKGISAAAEDQKQHRHVNLSNILRFVAAE